MHIVVWFILAYAVHYVVFSACVIDLAFWVWPCVIRMKLRGKEGTTSELAFDHSKYDADRAIEHLRRHPPATVPARRPDPVSSELMVGGPLRIGNHTRFTSSCVRILETELLEKVPCLNVAVVVSRREGSLSPGNKFVLATYQAKRGDNNLAERHSRSVQAAREGPDRHTTLARLIGYAIGGGTAPWVVFNDWTRFSTLSDSDGSPLCIDHNTLVERTGGSAWKGQSLPYCCMMAIVIDDHDQIYALRIERFPSQA